MDVPFVKYQGTGNDFILIDKRDLERELSVLEIQALCDRHFGIGSDGLIVVEKDISGETDFIMDFSNPDGSKSFCGNGSRCAAHFAMELGISSFKASFLAIDGIHQAEVSGNHVSILMRPVSEIKQLNAQEYFLHTGSPHHISWVHDIQTIDLITYGREIRYSEAYAPAGTNVNVLSQINEHTIAMRTYERGVEDETLSCGTGVTAAAISAGFRNEHLSSVIVKTKGGELQVKFERNANGIFENILLIGPAVPVFKGVVTL